MFFSRIFLVSFLVYIFALTVDKFLVIDTLIYMFTFRQISLLMAYIVSVYVFT